MMGIAKLFPPQAIYRDLPQPVHGSDSYLDQLEDFVCNSRQHLDAVNSAA